MEKSQEALVKGVTSGDCIILSGKMKKNSEEAPEEKILYLSMIQAPKSASSQKPEEDALGWEARDYLRQRVLGKVVKYTVDYKINEKPVGQIFLDNNNINLELVENGLAKVGFISKNNESMGKTDYYKRLQEAESQAKKEKQNIWMDSKQLESQKRKFVELDTEGLKTFLQQNKGKELDAVVEYVVNSSIFTVYLKQARAFVKLNLRFVAIPSSKDEILYKGGKAYAERQSLHRDVKVLLFNLDENGNFIGDILIPEKGSLALIVLKNGYTKVFVNNSYTYSADELTQAKDSQNSAKQNKLRLWKNESDDNYNQKESQSSSGSKSDINGTCIQVHSGDSITVKDNKGNTERIFLAHLKAPSLAKIGTIDPDQPWAWQAKEYLRKILVGKPVRAEFDYTKTLQKDNKQMSFFSVIRLDSNTKDKESAKEKNINQDLLEHGYANFVNVKSEETPSKYVDRYQIAEKTAKDQKLNLFSQKSPGNPNYSDLVSPDQKLKKKEFISFLSGKKKLNCVVEYVFSGSKLKLRIEQNKCMVPFNLLGIKVFGKDKNNNEIHEKFFKAALNYTNDNILQREGICDIITADRVGNYFGYLYIGGTTNYATTLLKEGLAVFNPYTQTPVTYTQEYKTAEKEAENAKRGIWSVDSLGNYLKEGEVQIVLPNKFEEKNQEIKLRVTDYIDFNNFYINVLPNKTMDTIEKVLSDYDNAKLKGTKIEPPVKIGLLCAAKYNVDEKYYRAKVIQVFRDNQVQVEFIDYGTVEKVNINQLIKLDTNISTFEPQAQLCELAYFKYSNNSMKRALEKFTEFNNIDAVLNGKILYTYNAGTRSKAGIVVYHKAADNKVSYNADLLRLGFAKFDKKKGTPSTISDLKEIEKQAESKSVGLWAEGETADYDEADEDTQDY